MWHVQFSDTSRWIWMEKTSEHHQPGSLFQLDANDSTIHYCWLFAMTLLVIHFGHGTPIFALTYIKIQYQVASIIIVIDSLKDFEWFWPIPTCLLHFLIALWQSNPSMESRKSKNKIVPQSYHSRGPVETGKFEIKLLITSYHHRSCLSRSMFFFHCQLSWPEGLGNCGVFELQRATVSEVGRCLWALSLMVVGYRWVSVTEQVDNRTTW